ncbi:MAG: LemA family protein [Propionibacteriales bacterium]|nr:LemA family protein [Propionibacteriales bacterium]
MSAGTIVLIIVIVIVLIIVALGLGAVGAYNGLVRARNTIQESWRQIDVELQRRYELIPNLVETVKGFADQERGVLEDVTRLRNQAAAARGNDGDMPSPARAEAEEQLSGAVRNLLVTVEAYPDLKSNGNFVELQRQLAETEDRIAAGRRYYNANVRVYNTKIESFPTNVIAGMFKFERATYFEVTEPDARQAPQVSFGDRSGQQDGQGAATTGQDGPRALPEQGQPPADGSIGNPSGEQAQSFPQYEAGDQPGKPGGDPLR